MNKPKIAFLCDGKACGCPEPNGCMESCFYTTKVEHAINFDLLDERTGYWAEHIQGREVTDAKQLQR